MATDSYDTLEVLRYNIRTMIAEPGKSPFDENCIDALLAILHVLERIQGEQSRLVLSTSIGKEKCKHLKPSPSPLRMDCYADTGTERDPLTEDLHNDPESD